MKKSLLALAVVAAIPAFAQAQTSNVVMYGRLDLGYNKTTGGVMNQAQQSGSRFGVRGAENLGGGTFATFQIEHRFNADTGVTSNYKMWHGRSIVGLRGGFGEINLGHNYTPLFWVQLAADPWGWDTVAQLSNTQTGTQVRFSNSLEYVTPNMGGLVGRLMWAPSEVAGRSANIGLSAVYSGGPLYLGLGYEKHGHAALGADAANVTSALPGAAANNTAMALTASYNLGFMRLIGNYSRTAVDAVSPATLPETAIRGTNLSAVFPMGKGEFRATVGNQTSRTVAATSISGSSVRDVGLGYHHNLSNRTTLYIDFNRGQTTNNATNVKTSATGYDFGIKHNF